MITWKGLAEAFALLMATMPIWIVAAVVLVAIFR